MDLVVLEEVVAVLADRVQLCQDAQVVHAAAMERVKGVSLVIVTGAAAAAAAQVAH